MELNASSPAVDSFPGRSPSRFSLDSSTREEQALPDLGGRVAVAKGGVMNSTKEGFGLGWLPDYPDFRDHTPKRGDAPVGEDRPSVAREEERTLIHRCRPGDATVASRGH